ncbi:MAG: LPS export ABC transporter periplasmic protein LptC, partial [Pyrinomonadaceae bacterium]
MGQEHGNENLKFRLPFYLRITAFLMFAVCVIAIAYSIYQSRNQPKFVMKGLPAELSKDVVAVVNNYERLEFNGQVPRYLIKAVKATTFADNHQELENVYIEVYDETGQNADKLSSERAIYIPSENKSFKVFFFGSVLIETRDRLIVRSEKISYDESSKIAESEGKTEFERENVNGSALNAKVFVNKSQVELFGDVQIFFNGDEEETRRLQKAQIKSDYAKFDKEEQKVEFKGSVFVDLQPKEEGGKPANPIEARAERLTCFFDETKIKRLELADRAEFFQKPTSVDKRYLKASALLVSAYFKEDLNKLELQGHVRIEVQGAEEGDLTRANAELVKYFKPTETLELKQKAEISTFQQNETSYLKGNEIKAEFFPNRKLKNAFVFGDAYFKQSTVERIVESFAKEMKVFYSDKHQPQSADAIGSASIIVTPSEMRDYSKATVFAPRAIRFSFAEGLLNQVQTEGRTSISLAAPPDRLNASNRKLTADTIKTVFRPNGKEFLRAEAIGSVLLE